MTAASGIQHSGAPTRSTASNPEFAIAIAPGAAVPISSPAATISRRATTFGSAPPCLSRASQYSDASVFDPRMLLISALMMA